MIKALQRKFVLIAMGSIFAVMLVVIGAINAVNFWKLDQRAAQMLSFLAQNNGRFPDSSSGMERGKPPKPPAELEITEESRFETRYFSVTANTSGSVVQIDTGHIAAISSEQAREMASAVLASGKSAGYAGYYRYQVASEGENRLILFLDCRSQITTALDYLLVSCAIGIISFCMVFILVSIFSRKAIRPVSESMEKQRRFVTDAGHEIKTPLAIIIANTDVLDLTMGENEWTQSIRNQARRLDDLVQRLLTMARLDEGREHLVFTKLSLGELVEEATNPFEILANSQEKHLEVATDAGIMVLGDSGALRELLSILMDNALKYTPVGQWIKVQLTRSGKECRLEVANFCDRVPEGNLERLFDRFYRDDPSRSGQIAGYGIGLSIARSIVHAHKGKITASASSDRSSICFTILLPTLPPVQA